MINKVAALACLQDMIAKHGNGRITSTTREAYALDTPGMIILVARAGAKVIGVAATILDEQNKTTRNSLVIVHKQFRNKGIGTILLTSRIMVVHEHGCVATACVAQDNIASNRMCEKANLVVCGAREATRSNGTFTQLLYSDTTR